MRRYLGSYCWLLAAGCWLSLVVNSLFLIYGISGQDLYDRFVFVLIHLRLVLF